MPINPKLATLSFLGVPHRTVSTIPEKNLKKRIIMMGPAGQSAPLQSLNRQSIIPSEEKKASTLAKKKNNNHHHHHTTTGSLLLAAAIDLRLIKQLESSSISTGYN